MCESMPDLSNITTVILAGGLGTRLRSVIPDKQKVLVEIKNRPFLNFLLDQLLSAGAREVVLCTGHRADEVQTILGIEYKSLKLVYSIESKPLGTGGALRLAFSHLTSDSVLIMNGDSYINVDLKDFLKWFKKKALAAALILTKMGDTSRYGRLVSDDEGRIQSFEEKSVSAFSGWINAGVYLLNKNLINSIPYGRTYSLENDFFPKLISDGLYGYQCEGEFIDIGTPESYLLAEDFFARLSLSV